MALEPSNDTDTPEVAEVMKNLLSSVGVDDYEPQVINMLTDFVYGYSREVLKDASAYGAAAGQAPGKVDLTDVTLAIQSRTPMSFAQAPPLEVLTTSAAKLNQRELPPLSGRLGLPVPGGLQALLATNVQYAGWDDSSKAASAPSSRPPPSSGAPSLPAAPLPSAMPSQDPPWKKQRLGVEGGTDGWPLAGQ